MNSQQEQVRIAVIGSGNIGTDILIKSMESKYLNPVVLVGRNANSRGLAVAKDLGCHTSTDGIDFLRENPDAYDAVFDATSASSHRFNNSVFSKHKKTAIDLTPAKIGKLCVPCINIQECISDQNINMITCGGQASIPLAYALRNATRKIDYLEIVSSISSASAGLATRENIDEYLVTTEHALKYFSGAEKTKAILNINPAIPCVKMQTTLYAKAEYDDLDALKKSVNAMAKRVSAYVPGYELVLQPVIKDDIVTLSVSVIGKGDFLPDYAGNLDIINCAAIATVEERCRLDLKVEALA